MPRTKSSESERFIQISIRIPPEIMDEVDKLAEKTGYTRVKFIREAMEMHIDSLKDVYQGEADLVEQIREAKGIKPGATPKKKAARRRK